MTSQAVMKRYLTAVSKTEEYAKNKTIQDLAIGIANFKKLEKKEQEQLNAYIEGAYNKLQAKGFSVKKTPTKTTTTRKTTTTEKGGLKAILDDLKKKLGAEKFKDATTGTDILKDIQIPALKKGKRIVRKKGYTSNFYGTFKNKVGRAYWESRANRYDANQPSQTRKYKLADGGEVGNKVYNEMYGVGSSKYLVNFHDGEKTHKDGSPFFDIRIFKNKVEKDKFVKELKSKGFVHKYAEGGEIEVGSIVNLPEIKMKDGRVQYERVVGGEVIGIEDGIYDVLNPKTNRLHRVTKQQIEQIDQAKAKHTRSRASLRSNEDTYPKGTEFAKGGKTKKIDYLRDAKELSEDERFELKVLQALGGFNNGLNINGLYESIGFSNYRFNQYATESQTKKVQKALSSLIKKEYVDESGLGYNITQKGANYKREFNFRSYAKGGTTKRIKRKGC